MAIVTVLVIETDMAIVTALAIETDMAIVTVLAIKTDMVIVNVLAIETDMAIVTEYQMQETRSRVDFLAPVTEAEVVETVTSLLRRPSWAQDT